MKKTGPFHDCCGTIHIHTTASDGGVDFADMVQAAADAGLDFIVLGDHNCIDDRYSNADLPVIVVPGIEFTPDYSAVYDEDAGKMKYDSGPDHLLAIGVTRASHVDNSNAQTNIDTVAKLGGLSFLAHPADYWLPWTDWGVRGYTGIEIWTYLSDWAEASLSAPSINYASRNPDAILNGPNKQILRRWDIEGQHRRVIGIGSTDTHSKTQIVNGQEVLVFPPERELNSLRTHVLLSDSLSTDREHAIRQILDGIAAGRCFVGLDALADTTGFQFWLEIDDMRVEMGSEVRSDETSAQAIMHICLPRAARIVARHNGFPLADVISRQLTLPTSLDSGVYRIEVYLNERPWILSNPIYVRD